MSQFQVRKNKRKLNKLKIKPFNVPPIKKQRLNTNTENNKNKNKKKNRKKEESGNSNEMINCLNDALPNDVEIAFNKLINEFPENILNPFPLLLNKNNNIIYGIPVILLTQIYSLIDDQTFVDQCIDKMKRNNIIRHFQIQIDKTKRKKIIRDLNTSKIQQNRNELSHKQYYDMGIIHLFVFTNQYNLYIINNIQSQFQQNRNDKENNFCFKILDKFINNLLPNYFNHIISKQEIIKYLIDDTIIYDNKTKQKLTDKIISLLMDCGLITQKMENIYSFSYPKSSKITRSISYGRQEIISFIWKKRYHEVLKKEILCHKMKNSCLDSLFHFRDLLGAQIIKQMECATGILIQMS